MLGTVEKLAEIFEITPNTIDNWEAQNCSGGKPAFLKEIKSLILAGFSLQEIKEMVSEEAVKQNQNDTIIYFDRSDMKKSRSVEEKCDQLAILNAQNQTNHAEVFSLFGAILKEMRQYTDRAIEAEKKVCLLEDYDGRAKQEYFEASTEIKRLQIQLEQKEKKLKEFEEQKKKLNLMEVQLRLLQLENNKKKSFWKFWQ